MNTIAIAAAVWAIVKCVGWRIDRRLVRLQRESLDATVRWAYARGRIDARRTRLDLHAGAELAVIEYRYQFGDTRREVAR
jgi:hypothetical protein